MQVGEPDRERVERVELLEQRLADLAASCQVIGCLVVAAARALALASGSGQCSSRSRQSVSLAAHNLSGFSSSRRTRRTASAPPRS